VESKRGKRQGSLWTVAPTEEEEEGGGDLGVYHEVDYDDDDDDDDNDDDDDDDMAEEGPVLQCHRVSTKVTTL
jgi:hypothetical protein